MSRIKTFTGLLIFGLLLSISGVSHSTPVYPTNIALGMTVTGSPYYNSGSEVFPYWKIVDGSVADGGSAYNWNFWLTPNGQTGWAQIDLSKEYSIGKIEFLNTHNRWYNDRTTRNWTIEILNSSLISMFSISGSESDLNMSPWTDPIPPKIIDLTMPVTGRYVKFSVNSYWGSSGGLNELRVYEAMPIPEPSTLFMLGIGLFGLIGCAYKRKKV